MAGIVQGAEGGQGAGMAVRQPGEAISVPITVIFDWTPALKETAIDLRLSAAETATSRYAKVENIRESRQQSRHAFCSSRKSWTLGRRVDNLSRRCSATRFASSRCSRSCLRHAMRSSKLP